MTISQGTSVTKVEPANNRPLFGKVDQAIAILALLAVPGTGAVRSQNITAEQISPPAIERTIEAADPPIPNLETLWPDTLRHDPEPVIQEETKLPPQPALVLPEAQPTPPIQNQEDRSAWITLLAVIGFLGAARGTIKMAYAVRAWFKDRKNFSNDVHFNFPSVNLHTIVPGADDSLRLNVRSIEQLALTDVFQSWSKNAVFKTARKLCTYDQPFPSLNLDRALRRWFFVVRDSRIEHSALQVLNKVFRDSYSSLYFEGNQAKEFGLPVSEKIHFIIPLCEKNSNGGMDSSFIAISSESFRLFADPQKIAQLRRGNPQHLQRRIDQLEKAFKLHCDFLTKGGKNADDPSHYKANSLTCSPCDYLFPRVAVAYRMRKKDLSVQQSAAET